MPKCPYDIIKIGNSAFVEAEDQQGRLNFGYNFEVTLIGYKVVSEWDEERDVEGSVLKTREKRHVWVSFFFDKEGNKIAETYMSNDWEAIKDLSDLPAGYKAPEQAPKQQPFLSMAVTR